MWRKRVFVNIYPLLLVCLKKICLNKAKFSSGLSAFKHGKKNQLSENFSALFWDSHFISKKKFFSEFPQKCFKTTERHSLAVCGSLCGEKPFLLIFIPFYSFNERKVVKTNLNFSLDLHLSNMVRKTNFQSISMLVSEIVTFMSKKKSSMLISP